MITRRDFMVSGITATGVGIMVPPVFAQSVFAATIEDIHNDHVLVILQLGGGNDGLNTVIPYTDPAYLQARPTIGIADDKVLPLNAEVGLNPVMPGMKKLFDAGEVALVQGVGYPNPVYSHFEGLYIWEHADPTMEQTDGWLGKLLASQLELPRTSAHRMRAGPGEHPRRAARAERNGQRHRVRSRRTRWTAVPAAVSPHPTSTSGRRASMASSSTRRSRRPNTASRRSPIRKRATRRR